MGCNRSPSLLSVTLVSDYVTLCSVHVGNVHVDPSRWEFWLRLTPSGSCEVEGGFVPSEGGGG